MSQPPKPTYIRCGSNHLDYTFEDLKLFEEGKIKLGIFKGKVFKHGNIPSKKYLGKFGNLTVL